MYVCSLCKCMYVVRDSYTNNGGRPSIEFRKYKCMQVVNIYVYTYVYSSWLIRQQWCLILNEVAKFREYECMQVVNMYRYMYVYSSWIRIYTVRDSYTNNRGRSWIELVTFVIKNVCSSWICIRTDRCTHTLFVPLPLRFLLPFLIGTPVLVSLCDSSAPYERWGAGVETQKNVRGEIGGLGRVLFNEPYAPSLSTIYDGA